MPALAINGGEPAVTTNWQESWPDLGKDEEEAVLAVMRTGKFSTPPVTKECEADFARYLDVRYALAHNNGTSALHAACFGVGLRPGDEVLVAPYAWWATIAGSVMVGATPVFCEVDPRTLTIDPADAARRITPRTRAIMALHLWGNICDMDAILDLARRHHLAVFENCSHAHGGEWRGQKVGTLGDAGCFSLQGGKAVVAGEGGVLATNRQDVYEAAVALGHYERLPELESDAYRRFAGSSFGFKYRAHPLGMAIAREQLKKLDAVNRARGERFEYLMSRLAEVPGIEVTETLPGAKRGGYYGSRVLYQPEELGGLPQERFVAALQAEGANARTERYPLYHQTYFYGQGVNYLAPGGPQPGARPAYRPGDLPVTEGLYDRLLALPVFTRAPKEVLDQYCEAFRKVVTHAEELGSAPVS
jgi:perosamine synthetase